MNVGHFAAALACVASLASPPADALTKMREGFATMVVTDGTSLMPRNPVRQARGGDDVYYWIQWQEPVPKSTLRCVIKGPDADLDDTELFAEAEGEGFSICGMGTEDSDAGTFVFTQYLDGEKVGEMSILVEKRPLFKMSLREKWKWMTTLLALVIIVSYWVWRKVTGDARSLKQVLGGESRVDQPIPGVVIGSRVGGAAQAATNAAPPETDDAEVLRKLGVQFRWLMGQSDKPKALDAGRQYLGLLMKAKNGAEALKVFKECLAKDPAFKLAQAEEVLPLAKAARAAGDGAAAVAAVRGFDKSFPGSALIPDVFIFSAKLLAEDLGRRDMAKGILEHVVQKYPGHYLAQEAKRYLKSMEQVT